MNDGFSLYCCTFSYCLQKLSHKHKSQQHCYMLGAFGKFST